MTTQWKHHGSTMEAPRKHLFQTNKPTAYLAGGQASGSTKPGQQCITMPARVSQLLWLLGVTWVTPGLSSLLPSLFPSCLCCASSSLLPLSTPRALQRRIHASVPWRLPGYAVTARMLSVGKHMMGANPSSIKLNHPQLLRFPTLSL